MPVNRQNKIDGSRFRRVFVALVVVIILTAASSPAFAQGVTTQYVYDDNGRLRAVVAPNGEANIYEYDAAGNITAIRRNTASTLEVLDFYPREGAPGTQVTIIGTGFGAGVNSVAFNGAAAQIVSANAPIVVVTVPSGATTGPITITTPQGSTTTSQPFVVKGVQLTPVAVSLNPGQTQQFTAVVYPTGSDQSVVWSVNEIDGGNTSVGTINTTGLYTAPEPTFSALIVRATSVADPSLFSEAQVTVRTTQAAIASSVLVARAASPTPPTTLTALGAGVLIQREAPPAPTTTLTALGAGVLIQREAPPPAPTTLTAIGTGVTTKTGPYISTITPSQVARGATVTMTITGTNLSGVTTIRFSNGSGGIDANIITSNLNVDGGGASLTATLTVPAGAALGRRLVVVSTASASSLTFDNGLNGIEIVP